MEQKEDEITTVEVLGTELQLLREKAQIDIQVSTARAFPRDIKQCLENALFTATMDIETASTCTYAVPRAGKAITGPSVHLAKIILQSWGNMRAEAKVVEETSRHVISEGYAWDLQNNVAVKVTVKRSIMQNKGKDRMADDMITVTGNAANAIALRNAVFTVLPKAITDKVYNAVQAKIIGDEHKFNVRLKKVIEGFKNTYQKDEPEVLALVGKDNRSQIKPADLVVLIGIATAIQDGDTQLDNVFKPAVKTTEEKKADLKEKQELDLEKKKEDISYNEESAKLDAELAKEAGVQGKIEMP